MVYDVTDRESFRNIENWVKEIEKYASDSVVKLLVGNKADLSAKKVVTTEEGMKLAESLHVKFLETSAKNSQNVEQAFTTMAGEIRTKVAANKATSGSGARGRQLPRISPGQQTSINSNSCCSS